MITIPFIQRTCVMFNIYWYMFFDFHSVFWHAVDVLVILRITPSIPFHCPCL